VTVVYLLQTNEPLDPTRLISDGVLLSLATIIGLPFHLAIFFLAARLRGRVLDYLALVRPARREVLVGAASLAALLLAFEAVTWLMGRDSVPPFMVDIYRTARASNVLILFAVAVAVAAPLGEELAFRGFLFRGWAASPLGVAGTVVLTSVLWSLLHVQYDLILIAQIFGIGLVLGWVRARSGSSALTIGLHAANNLVALVQAVVKVEWLS